MGVEWDLLRQPCPVPEGTRIRLTHMGNDPDPIPVGSEGEVIGGSGLQLWVKWDNGRNLNLSLPEDKYEILG